MTKEECLELINKIMMDRPENVLSLYFVQKLTSQAKYRSFQPTLKAAFQGQILAMILPRLKQVIEKNTLVEYNAVGVADEEIESISKTEVEAIDVFMKSIDDENLCKEMENLQVEKVAFYCLRIVYQGEEIFLFRQFSKLKKLRSGILSHFVKDELVAMEGDFLGIDEDTDMLLSKDVLMILNHISLERVFNYRDAYRAKTDEAMGAILTQGVMTNIEQFAEDCCRDVRIMKRFTNIMSQGRLPLFFENYDKVEEIVKNLDLDIDFDDDGKMIYREKSQLYHIVNLMSDSYFRSLLADRFGISKTEEAL